MTKKEKPKAGRFVHIDFPPKGFSSSADVAFLLSQLHATALELSGKGDIKVSDSDMIEEEKPPKPNVIRIVK